MWSARRQAAVLLVVGAAAGLAALFGPVERWGGVDVGATGASLFNLALIAAIVLFALRSEQIFPEDVSVAERRAWIGILFLALILLSFSRFMAGLSNRPVPPAALDDLHARHFLQQLFVLFVGWQLFSHLAGRHAGSIALDERDLRFAHSAARAGDLTLSVIVVGCVCVLALAPAALLTWWLAPIVLANLLIGVLIARSLVEHLVLTFAYIASRR